MNLEQMEKDAIASAERGANKYLPDHMVDGVIRYIVHGIRGGSFLSAVLHNDLMEALAQGDEVNQRSLPEYGMYLFNDVPRAAFGSPEAVNRWCEMGGLVGLYRDLRRDQSQAQESTAG